MIAIVSHYQCPSCEEPLRKTNEQTGVWLHCANERCESEAAGSGLEGQTEEIAFVRLDRAVQSEIEEAEMISEIEEREIRDDKTGDYKLDRDKAERRP